MEIPLGRLEVDSVSGEQPLAQATEESMLVLQV
jgi:hypothetical protein